MIKRTLQMILSKLSNEDLIEPVNYESGEYLSQEDIAKSYSIFSSIFGKENAILIGGAALQNYYPFHKPKDIDVVVDGNVEEMKDLLYDKGFRDIKDAGSKPLFNADIHVSYLQLDNKKIRVEFYSSEGLLDKNEGFENLRKNALYREYNGQKIYFVDPLNLCRLKYNAWRNRLMNGRCDKDIIDLKEANLLDYIDKNDKYYRKISKAYNPGVISRLKSVLSDAVHIAHQEYLKRYSQ
ncbi:MAG: hypothetical protein ACP5MV_04010 [Candidatus Parvarchaeum sp.]